MKVLILTLFSLPLFAQDLSRYVNVKSLYIEGEKRIGTNREYFLKNSQNVKHDVNLGLDLDLPLNLYYNSIVTSITDTRQFRHVGYELELGHRPFNGVEVYIQHFSGHALDEQYDRAFPQSNKVGVRLILWKSK